MPDEEPASLYPMRITDASGAEVPVITAPGGYRCIGELSVTFDADAIRARASHLAAGFGIAAPQVAVTNGGGIRNDSLISAGNFTTGMTWDIAPFNNFVVVGETPRETLRSILEQAVSSVPGAGGQFAQVSGFTFEYDGTVIVHNGSVVPGPAAVLAIVDILANGGDCYPLREVEITRLGVTYQQALADYIAQDLGGLIGADDYPTDGGGRITVVAPTDASGTRSYTVRPGDTLRNIAQSLLGSELRWPEIFALNQGNTQADGRALTNPDLIHVDMDSQNPLRLTQPKPTVSSAPHHRGGRMNSRFLGWSQGTNSTVADPEPSHSAGPRKGSDGNMPVGFGLRSGCNYTVRPRPAGGPY